MTYSVDFTDDAGNWPSMAGFKTENHLTVSLFDGWSASGVRDRIEKVRAACNEMEAKANELGL